jgi:thioesterase domain-containing protein
LLGICWGAIAALEVARQLRAAGEDVSALVLLDPPPAGEQLAARTKKGVAGRESVPQFIASRLKLYRQTLRQLPAAQRRAFLGEKLRMLMDIVRQRDLFRGDASELRRRRVLAANLQAARRYTAKAVDCPVHLVFTAERTDGPSRAARAHWLEILSPATPPDSVPGSDTGDAISADRAHHVAEVISRRLR